jgi:hypothetical protein
MDDGLTVITILTAVLWDEEMHASEHYLNFRV